jgi:hypothetical protein
LRVMRSHLRRITPFSSGAVLHECCGEQTRGQAQGESRQGPRRDSGRLGRDERNRCVS